MTVKEELHEFIDALSEEEAVALLEDLRPPDAPPIEEWQRREIEERKARLQRDPSRALDWDGVRERIQSAGRSSRSF